MPDRHIEFQRCFNFRDLGGYESADGRHVRWRRLFRSMTPEYMTEADVRFARECLRIWTVLDLRQPEDADSGKLGAPPARRLVVPFPVTGSQSYDLPANVRLSQKVDLIGPLIVESLEFIVAGNGATLFHCTGGRDRAGIFAAIVLKLLDVSDDGVIEDFMHSASGEAKMRAYSEEIGERFPPRPPYSRREAPPPIEERWLRLYLDELESRGGAAAYLMDAGASRRLIARFCALAME